MNALVRRRRCTSPGQALVEFALIIPLLILVVAGLFDIGRAVYAFNALSNAAREALREAVVHQDDAAIEARADRILGGLAPDTTFVHDKSDCTPVVSECLYGVELTYSFTPVTPLVGAVFDPVISASASMPVETIN